jgi:hypothetical protein
MSRKQSKHIKKHPQPRPNQDSGQHQTMDNMHINGNVEISRSPSLEEQYKTERKEDSTHENKKYFVEKLTLGAIILYSFLTFLMYCATKKAADAAANGAAASVKQLGDFEAVQAARLIFEDFKVTIIPGKDFNVTGSIVVRNAGTTVADDISFDCQSGAYNLEYNPNPPTSKGEQKPRPNLGGSSLAPGHTNTYPIHTDVGISFPKDFGVTIPGFGTIHPQDMIASTEDVEAGRLRYSVNPSVSYNDVFGHAHIVTDCWTYVSKTKAWISCPNLRQHQ